jgi:hypothetical protein
MYDPLYVNASEVAAVCGLNPFQDADAAFFKLVERSRRWRTTVAATKRALHVSTEEDAFAALIAQTPALEAVLSAGVAAATRAGDARELEVTLRDTVRQATALVEPRVSEPATAAASEPATAAASASASEPATASAAEPATATTTTTTTATEPATDAEPATAIAAEPKVQQVQQLQPLQQEQQARNPEQAAVAKRVRALEDDVVREVQLRRGVAMEAAILDDAQERPSVLTQQGAATVVLSDRNATMRFLRTPRYVIGGRIDGYDAASRCVVEVKTRRRAWATPPRYDLAQLRVYVHMLRSEARTPEERDAIFGLLVERFPDGKTRDTRLSYDADEWAALDAGLMRAADRFDALSLASVSALVARFAHA